MNGRDLGIECSFYFILIFYPSEIYQIGTRGICFVGPNPQTTKDFSYLINKQVLIGNEIYICHSVERYAHAGLHYCGERIGVIVRSL